MEVEAAEFEYQYGDHCHIWQGNNPLVCYVQKGSASSSPGLTVHGKKKADVAGETDPVADDQLSAPLLWLAASVSVRNIHRGISSWRTTTYSLSIPSCDSQRRRCFTSSGFVRFHNRPAQVDRLGRR
jgi:hypothetical protein